MTANSGLPGLLAYAGRVGEGTDSAFPGKAPLVFCMLGALNGGIPLGRRTRVCCQDSGEDPDWGVIM